MNLFKAKKKRCSLCDIQYPINENFHELRLEVQEGQVTLEICKECADFLDLSANAINGKREDEPI